MQRTLYPHARIIYFFGARECFAADRVFIDSVGRLTRRRDMPGEVAEFQRDPRNHGFVRRSLRFRVSARRMQHLFDEVWCDPAMNPPPGGTNT